MDRAADDVPTISERLRALRERQLRLCYRRTKPEGRELNQCWCYRMAEPGVAAYDCPTEGVYGYVTDMGTYKA